ncbi:glycosyltransferase, partial [Candidatus Pacearchaeota archaeon]|nr:glycosyltransferase [Candidatus Pacearchaeota archaeon]
PHKFLVCHNGINTENFSALVNLSYIRKELGIAEGSLVIGHVGSFRKVKNHETIIKIAEHVLKERKDVSFLLIGEGSLRQKIEKEVAKRNMSGHFVFTGNRHDIPPLLSAMNVFVVPSLNEGFATVITEAQAAGLPVVASDLPSIREALSPEMHKFCCNPLDSKSMAEHILLLLQNPSLRKELGSKGRAYAIEKFSIEKTVKQLESIYLNGLQ